MIALYSIFWAVFILIGWLQLVMQYLYFGGTDAVHIRNTDVMEVSSSFQIFRFTSFINISYRILLLSCQPSRWLASRGLMIPHRIGIATSYEHMITMTWVILTADLTRGDLHIRNVVKRCYQNMLLDTLMQEITHESFVLIGVWRVACYYVHSYVDN